MELLAPLILFSIFASFLCSLLEAVILSTSHAHVEVLKKEGRKCAGLLEELKARIDRPLAAILTINTAANTLGGAGVGSILGERYGSNVVAIASGLLTVVILIFSEIIPKTLGAHYWKRLAPFAAYTIRIMIVLTFPFVKISEFIANRIEPEAGKLHRMTREEMIVSAEIGVNEGTIKRKESLVIKNLLRLDKIFVRDIQTPRSVLVALPRQLSIGEVMDKFSPIPFSRIPIFDSNLDSIVGVVLRYKILEAYARDEVTLHLDEISQPAHTILESEPVSHILDEFIKRKEHMFIVTDAYGTTVGLVTLEDCIETLLGVEIVDEFDSVEDMRQFALEQWERRKQERLLAAGKKISQKS